MIFLILILRLLKEFCILENKYSSGHNCSADFVSERNLMG